MNEHPSLNVADERLQLVCFTVGGEEFGVNIRHVQEINRTLEITQIPETPEHNRENQENRATKRRSIPHHLISRVL